MTKRKTWIFALLTILLIGGGGLCLWRTGFFEALSSAASMERSISRFSPFGQCFFFLIQLLSVVLAPIPSNITALAGALLFGMWQSFFLTYAAVALGSFLVFYLARILGRPFADKLVSRKLSEKYLDVIRAKQDIFLILAFLLPFFSSSSLRPAPGAFWWPARWAVQRSPSPSGAWYCWDSAALPCWWSV